MAFTRRSEGSRARILEVARAHFVNEGFAATLKDIAADADINASMVVRYFGNKEGLFAEAGDFDLKLPDLSSVAAEIRGQVLAAHLVALWEGPWRDRISVLMRVCMSNEHARDRLFAIFEGQILDAVRPVCAPFELQERAAMLFARILGLAFERYGLKLPAIVEMKRDRFLAALEAACTTCLVDPLPGSDDPTSSRRRCGTRAFA